MEYLCETKFCKLGRSTPTKVLSRILSLERGGGEGGKEGGRRGRGGGGGGGRRGGGEGAIVHNSVPSGALPSPFSPPEGTLRTPYVK